MKHPSDIAWVGFEHGSQTMEKPLAWIKLFKKLMSARLAYHVHKSGCKTPIVIVQTLILYGGKYTNGLSSIQLCHIPLETTNNDPVTLPLN